MSDSRKQPDSEDRLDAFLKILEDFRSLSVSGDDPDPQQFASRLSEMEAELAEAVSTLRRNSKPSDEKTFQPSIQETTSISSPPLQTLRHLKGQKLGNYHLIGMLGEGAMGVVYEARDLVLNKKVAIKITKNCELTELGSLRLKQEATIVASLQHDHIVPVFGFEEHNGYTYYIMQFIEGSSLGSFRDDPPSLLRRLRELEKSRERNTLKKKLEKWRAANSRRLADKSYRTIELADQVAKIGYALAGALEYAHRRGVQHLDVKPSNVLLDETGKVWLTDFGLAEVHQTQTSEGNWVGTVGYMSPEMLGLVAPGRLGTSDIYSLGATLYCLIAGKPPYDGKAEKYRDWMIHGNVPPLQRFMPGIPHDLESIILKAINRDVTNRYQSAAELATDLDCYLNRLPITSLPTRLYDVTRKAIYRNRQTLILVAAVAFLAMASFSYVSWQYYNRAAISEENYSELVTNLFRNLNEHGNFRNDGDPKSQYERLKLITDFLDSRDRQGNLRENERFLLAQFHYYTAKQLAALKINAEEVYFRLDRSAELFTTHFDYSKDPIHRLDAARSILFKAECQFYNQEPSAVETAKHALVLVERLNSDYPDDLRFLDAIACYSRVVSDSFLTVKDYDSARKSLDYSILISRKLQALSPDRWWFYAFNECMANHSKLSILVGEEKFEQVIVHAHELSNRIDEVIEAMKESGEYYESMNIFWLSSRSACVESLIALQRPVDALVEIDIWNKRYQSFIKESPNSVQVLEYSLSMLLNKIELMQQLDYPHEDIQVAMNHFEAALPADEQIRTRYLLYNPRATQADYEKCLEVLEKKDEEVELGVYGLTTKLIAMLLLDRLPDAVELHKKLQNQNVTLSPLYEILLKIKLGNLTEAEQQMTFFQDKYPVYGFQERAAMKMIFTAFKQYGFVWNAP